MTTTQIAAADSTNDQLWGAVVWMIPVVVVVAAIIVCVRLYRSGQTRAYDRETDRQVRLQAHDAWRATASRRAFEQHQRECSRCRRGVFGPWRFAPPPSAKK